jgi:8-oxo-dGTP pyrophosphatase MutT (NUDIX family)
MLSKQPKTKYLSSTVSLIQDSLTLQLKNEFTKIAKTIVVRDEELSIIGVKVCTSITPTNYEFVHQISHLAYVRGKIFPEMANRYHSKSIDRVVNRPADDPLTYTERLSESLIAFQLYKRAKYVGYVYDFYTQLSERQYADGYHPLNSAPQFHYMVDLITSAQFNIPRDIRTCWAGVHIHANGSLIALETLKYKFTVPGGSGKLGERPVDSAVRELIEEVGLPVFGKIAQAKWSKVDVNWVGNGIDLHINLPDTFELGFTPGQETWHLVWYKGLPPVNSSLHQTALDLSDLFWAKCRHDMNGDATNGQLKYWLNQTHTKIVLNKFLTHYDALDEYGKTLITHFKCIPQILNHIQRN